MLITFNCKTWQWLFNGNLHDTFLKIVNERVSLRIIGMVLKGFFFFNEFIENILDTFAKE